jgi:hypothetical protein
MKYILIDGIFPQPVSDSYKPAKKDIVLSEKEYLETNTIDKQAIAIEKIKENFRSEQKKQAYKLMEFLK